MFHARHPIRPLSMNQVAYYVIRAPATRAFRTRYPVEREIAEQYVQNARSPRQHRHRSMKIEIHVLTKIGSPRRAEIFSLARIVDARSL
jgi:hypothetical protein